jgi:peptidoglycan hydrolase CwlO-like protein
MDDGKKVQALEAELKKLQRLVDLLVRKDSARDVEVKRLKNRVTQLEQTVEALRRRG